MTDALVVFDVDGVLLELTRPEEEAFFHALAHFVPTMDLSRNWNSYRIRNDDDIIAEILEINGRPAGLKPKVIEHYLGELAGKVANDALGTRIIAGADYMLAELSQFCGLGIATANFREAARMRLEKVGMWQPVSAHAFGGDGGGHKHEILARLLATVAIPKHRVVYVGDNVNDVEAGLRNGVHFIGFSASAERRQAMAKAGAKTLSQSHSDTLTLIGQALNA